MLASCVENCSSVRIPRLCVSPDISEAAPSFITTWAKTSTLTGLGSVYGGIAVAAAIQSPGAIMGVGGPTLHNTAAQNWHHHSRKVSTGGRTQDPQRGWYTGRNQKHHASQPTHPLCEPSRPDILGYILPAKISRVWQHTAGSNKWPIPIQGRTNQRQTGPTACPRQCGGGVAGPKTHHL